MKRIEYLYNIPINLGDEENPVWEDNLYQKSLPYSAEAEEIAQREAYDGKYTVKDDGVVERIIAPYNVVSGEFVTVNGVLYKAIENIPNGEPIIVGQNAIETTIEKQLYELKGE